MIDRRIKGKTDSEWVAAFPKIVEYVTEGLTEEGYTVHRVRVVSKDRRVSFTVTGKDGITTTVHIDPDPVEDEKCVSV